ncbi:uncharacterized protein B0H18DRAFT_1017777 [Fomitopsis serialis]|uniref:uncharacterized protein n=1 Tax=Fomitopsis serialis TaxID=139415 RepID=UPI002007A726|nr:uncharacterized protein B0H18DRAFT_1017777 [Neoantrodia serialis]KAH9922485.1 hypothetical protein B0H18DRAFT_1017777 [Neoantrodia serialis]
MGSRYNWLEKVAKNADSVSWAQDMSVRSSTYDAASYSLQKRRAHLKAAFEAYIAQEYQVSADDSWRLQDIGGKLVREPGTTHDVVACETYSSCWYTNLDHIENFLSLRARFVDPAALRQEQGQTNVTYSTLSQWKDVMVHSVYRNHPEGAKLLSEGLYARLYQHIAFLQTELNLQRHRPVQEGFGRLEMRLVTERLYATAKDPLLANQLDVAWKLCFLTGCRAGSIGHSNPKYKAAGQYMKIGDIIRLTRQGYMQWQIELHINNLKGHNSGEGKTIVFIFRPVKSPLNIVFDIGLLIVINLFLRGMLYHSTWQDVCNDEAFELRVRPEFKDHALICKGMPGGRGVHESEPMRSSSLQKCFKKVAQECGFLNPKLYNLRRDFAEDMLEEFGAEVAREGMGHEENPTLRRHYVQSVAGKDVVGLRTGEALVSRKELTWIRQPALHENVRLMAPAELSHLGANGVPSSVARTTGPILPVKDTAVETSVFIPPTFTEAELEADDEYQRFFAHPDRSKRVQEVDELKATLESAIGGSLLRGSKEDKVDDCIAAHSDRVTLTEKWERYKKAANTLSTTRSRKRKQILDKRVKAAKLEWEKVHPASVTTLEQTSAGQTTAERLAKANLLEQGSPLLRVALTYAPTSNISSGVPTVTAVPVASVTDTISTEPVMNELDTAADPSSSETDSTPGTFEELDTGDLDLVPLDVMAASYAQMVMSVHRVKASRECIDCHHDPTTKADMMGKTFLPHEMADHQRVYHTTRNQVFRFWEEGESWTSARVRKRWPSGGCFLCYADGKAYRKYTKSGLTGHLYHTSYHAEDPRVAAALSMNAWKKKKYGTAYQKRLLKKNARASMKTLMKVAPDPASLFLGISLPALRNEEEFLAACASVHVGHFIAASPPLPVPLAALPF